MAKKDDRGYRDYSVMKGGKLYGQVAIPIGNGKYKVKVKRVKTKTEARQWGEEYLRKLGLGETVEEPDTKKKGMSFLELAEWYKPQYCFAPKYSDRGVKEMGMRDYEGRAAMIDRLVKYFGHYQLDAITFDVLRDYKIKRLSGKIVHRHPGHKTVKAAGIATTNKEFSLMGTMFRRAVNREWMKRNPFNSDENLIEKKKEFARIKTLNDEMADRLIECAPLVKKQPLLKELLTVMRWTGARPSEIFPFKAKDDGVPREPLCWKNILKHDFKAVTMVEYKDTIRVERVIPARPELQQCLRDLYARRPLAKPDDLLFPFKSFPRAWKTVCELAGIESGKAGTVSRDFRAYFNNKLIEWKTPDVIRMLIMGHTDVKSNKDYSLITPEVINSFQFGPVVEVSAAVN